MIDNSYLSVICELVIAGYTFIKSPFSIILFKALEALTTFDNSSASLDFKKFKVNSKSSMLFTAYNKLEQTFTMFAAAASDKAKFVSVSLIASTSAFIRSLRSTTVV
ncbi:ORF051 [Staphylococcus phage 85]|uniref:ORF051 n=1 Tax=Staphylococcus phage 85 TaxID=2908111 RepID=Q4ZDB1_9CAUD|nr:ORF051 [Staphylococcus phage 85]